MTLKHCIIARNLGAFMLIMSLGMLLVHAYGDAFYMMLSGFMFIVLAYAMNYARKHLFL